MAIIQDHHLAGSLPRLASDQTRTPQLAQAHQAQHFLPTTAQHQQLMDLYQLQPTLNHEDHPQHMV